MDTLILANAMLFLSTLSLRRATIIGIINNVVDRVFLSTLSLRRATNCQQRSHHECIDFYPRSPCGERLGRAFWPGLSY